LRPRTRHDYEGIFRNHIEPHLGAPAVGEISTATVQQWRAQLLDRGMGENRATKVYRLLRAILNTAVDDGMIKRNPCRIKGADREREGARPVASVPQVYALADAVPPRFRALVLLGAFTSLRWGELINLRRIDVDLVDGILGVTRTLIERDDGTLDDGHTKSDAGIPTVSVPVLVLPDLAAHIAEHVGDEPTAYVFLGELGERLRRSNFRRATQWRATVQKVGLPADLHFHDLRHTGNQLAAEAGATTRELMRRMGHSVDRRPAHDQRAARGHPRAGRTRQLPARDHLHGAAPGRPVPLADRLHHRRRTGPAPPRARPQHPINRSRALTGGSGAGAVALLGGRSWSRRRPGGFP
jgi:Site-specific recombinase XerC